MRLLKETDHLPAGSTAAAIGMFDGVHRGHALLVSFLRQQAAEAGLQSLVVTFTKHPQQVLHPDAPLPLILPLERRLELLEQLHLDLLLPLDFTMAMSQLDAAQFIGLLRDHYGVRLLVMGYNHRFGHGSGLSFADYVRQGAELGVRVVKAPEYLGEYAPVSSTIIRRLIAAGKVDDAMGCMGRPYRLSGRVVHGFHNGSGLGFPTANVGDMAAGVVLPHQGAYAVLATVSGQQWQGMANIGHRPTMANGDEVSIEVNLFDFDGDIYGAGIDIDFIRFLRLEFKMCGVDELRQQLSRDRSQAQSILNDYLNKQS